MPNMRDRAVANLERLRANPYPGSLVVTGMDATRRFIMQAVAITARSEEHRNRIYVEEPGGLVRTVVRDRLRSAGDPHNTLYTALQEADRNYVAGNGKHTDVILAALTTRSNVPMRISEGGWRYENDPSSTPRIAAWCTVGRALAVHMAILRRPSRDTQECLHDFYAYDSGQGQLPGGIGWCLQTYEGPGDPPPSFGGAPYPLSLRGDEGEVAERLWGALNADNRVCLAVKFIPLTGGASRIALLNKVFL